MFSNQNIPEKLNLSFMKMMEQFRPVYKMENEFEKQDRSQLTAFFGTVRLCGFCFEDQNKSFSIRMLLRKCIVFLCDLHQSNQIYHQEELEASKHR